MRRALELAGALARECLCRARRIAPDTVPVSLRYHRQPEVVRCGSPHSDGCWRRRRCLRRAVFSTLDARCKAHKESHRRLDLFPFAMKDALAFAELLGSTCDGGRAPFAFAKIGPRESS